MTWFWVIHHTLVACFVLFKIRFTVLCIMHLISWLYNLTLVRFHQVSSSMVWYQNILFKIHLFYHDWWYSLLDHIMVCIAFHISDKCLTCLFSPIWFYTLLGHFAFFVSQVLVILKDQVKSHGDSIMLIKFKVLHN